MMITLSTDPAHIIYCTVLNEEPIATYDTFMFKGVVDPLRGRHIIDTILIRIPWDDIDAHAIMHRRMYAVQKSLSSDRRATDYKFDIRFSELDGVPDVDAVGCFLLSTEYNVCDDGPNIVYGISADFIPQLRERDI
jgi:hypothetical protein